MYSNRLPRITSPVFLAMLLVVLAGPAHAQQVDPAPPAADLPPTEVPDTQPGEAAPTEQGEPSEPKPPTDSRDDPPAEEQNHSDASREEDSKQSEEEASEEEVPAPLQITWSNEIDEVLRKKSPQSVQDLRVIQNQVRQVVAAGRKATVGVQVGGVMGSAVVVSPDGLVLTAGHVAMKPNKPVVFFFSDGSRARGVTLGVNRAVDSGMMRITDKGPWPYMPMAPVESVKPGVWVVGLGQPNGYFKDRAPPVRLGRVLFGDKTTLCTDVTLVGGDSGGPLFNLHGQVVGIHSRIGRKIVSNYHVPIDQYHMTWDRLAGGQMWGGRFGAEEPARHRPWLGVAGNSSSGRCKLTQVFPGLPADRAGLQVGDVVTQFGGEQVETFDQLAKLVLTRPIGSRVKIQLEREGEELTVQVRLGVIARGFPGSPKVEEDS